MDSSPLKTLVPQGFATGFIWRTGLKRSSFLRSFPGTRFVHFHPHLQDNSGPLSFYVIQC